MNSSSNDPERQPQLSAPTPVMASPAASTQRLRNEDSWVDISSQPSSSSLSSAGDNEVIVEGLNVRPGSSNRRSHQLKILVPSKAHLVFPAGPGSANGSSQDEYEESESESDRVLSSSNEDMGPLLEDDEDDNVTALGVSSAENLVFTPQPNAFSHPPTQKSRVAPSARPVPNSFFPLFPEASTTASAEPVSTRTIAPRNSRQQRLSLPRSFPNDGRTAFDAPHRNAASQPDHDAALRASLTTLLSCAAAVRGSPKQRDSSQALNTRRQSRMEPQSLRLVSESDLLDEEPITTSRPSTRQNTSAKTSSPSAKLQPAPKRKSRESSKERHAKKARNVPAKVATDDELILNSTLTTWMISAGVVLVFSAISFSAGYAWGKEVGRLEGEMGLGTQSCGKEALRGGGGLRRLKWSTASSSLRA